ncbi:MAG: ferredoxin, partial [Woeseiaceae bacterium]
SFDEPWLDTAMCTTCDDCMGINKMMFAYNEDKQAYIKDATAGTFAQLVAAAEICPAKCIHPGKPLNPDEPGLDELIARAAPFN